MTKFYFEVKLSQKLKFVLKKISITQIHSIQSQLILEPSSQQHMENRELIFAQTISASIIRFGRLGPMPIKLHNGGDLMVLPTLFI